MLTTTATMKTSDKGVGFIKRHEGLRLEAYKDVAGYWTIGYGHLIKLPQERYFVDVPTTESVATHLLKQDLATAEQCVLKNIRVPLSQFQFDALVSFTYNVGCGALERSTLLHLLNRGEYDRAAQQFERWNKAGGKVVAGLTKRRKEERDLFINGEYDV